jgi:osmotically inducible protein OsmC
MAARTANALWEGTLKEGRGQMALGSGTFEGEYTFKSRFEGDSGSNPEELIAAALAGCYSMQLSAVLGEGGNDPEFVQTNAKVSMRMGDEGPRISKIALTTTAKVPGIGEAAFDEAAATAKQACLVARALAGVEEITLDASLES